MLAVLVVLVVVLEEDVMVFDAVVEEVEGMSSKVMARGTVAADRSCFGL